MGAGKSAVGRRLADLLDRQFFDLDRAVEKRADMAVAEVFSRRGEGAFRRLEHQVLGELAGRSAAVTALGGGTMLAEENREILAATGVSVWLDLPFDRIAARLTDDERRARPLFADLEEARLLYRQRLPVYRLSDLRLAVASGLGPRGVAEEVAALLRRERCAI